MSTRDRIRSGEQPDDARAGLTEVTVKFSPKSVNALEHASSVAAITRTDTINRAVQLYDYVVGQMESDGVLIIEKNGRQETISIV